MFMGLALGAIAGFLLSSLTDSFYVDFNRVEAEDIPDIDQNDTRWIGKVL